MLLTKINNLLAYPLRALNASNPQGKKNPPAIPCQV